MSIDLRHKILELAIVVAAVLASLPGCSSPPDEQARLQSAREHQAAGEFRASIIDLKKILEYNPDHRDARLLLGELYLKIGRGVVAEKELRHAQRLGVPAARLLVPLGEAVLAQENFDRLLDEIRPDESLPA